MDRPSEASQEEILALLDHSVELELNVSELYLLFSSLYPEDADFWWKIAMEEKNHASLLRSGEPYITLGLFPDDVLLDKLETISSANGGIKDTIKRFKAAPPERETAYRYAMELEKSSAELHFQHIMTEETDDKVIKIFQSLAGDDIDHARRIRTLLKQYDL